MPSQPVINVENNFNKGLITESTGLNFPENAATDTDNCVFDLIGDVYRRLGIDYEDNFGLQNLPNNSAAYTTYKWDNAGGDGSTQIVVTQIGTTLSFYLASAVTTSNSLSACRFPTTIALSSFSTGGSFDATLECQYATGNGYLFVFHPSMDPVYVVYNSGTITANSIVIRARDFTGALEPGNPPTTLRPGVLSTEHLYNLTNQGWNSQNAWNFKSVDQENNIQVPGGSMFFHDAPTGLSILPGDPVTIQGTINTTGGTNSYVVFGLVQAYSGGTLIILVSSFTQTGNFLGLITGEVWYVQSGGSSSYISTWVSQISNYPSNADVWWRFKDSTNLFHPAVTVANVTLSSPAPNGSLIVNVFDQNFPAVAGIPGLGRTKTNSRPRTGTWFQGRAWYAGVDASQVNAGPGQNAFYTWTENIYFSQVITGNSTDFGLCYQTNDPTSEDLFDLLPTDGGVITIPGCGAVYKLFPIQNGMLVFAANGVWFITGSQGIGFSANDYTIVKLSEVKSISGSTFTDVLGLPFFWNEEGIYQVQPQQTGSLAVEPITVGTILSFYNDIPTQSRRYAKGVYDPINYVIQWIYKSTSETSVTDRYMFDRVLNYNTYNKAFYPYTINGIPSVHSIVYVASPGGTFAPDPIVKFFTEDPSHNFTFAEENNTSYIDFQRYDNVGEDFSSFFITGYKIRGQAQRKFQPLYVHMYTKTNDIPAAYNFQGIWDYSNNLNSNRFSTVQKVYLTDLNYDVLHRRHKVRGHGYAIQFKISSVSGYPFDIIGWATTDTVNASP